MKFSAKLLKLKDWKIPETAVKYWVQPAGGLEEAHYEKHVLLGLSQIYY
jgi:hypothetical protein